MQLIPAIIKVVVLSYKDVGQLDCVHRTHGNQFRYVSVCKISEIEIGKN
jgi:hypothetical protein